MKEKKFYRQIISIGATLLILFLLTGNTPAYAISLDQQIYDCYAENTSKATPNEKIDTLILGDESAATLNTESWHNHFQNESLNISIKDAGMKDLNTVVQHFIKQKKIKHLILVLPYQIARDKNLCDDPSKTIDFNHYILPSKKTYQQTQENLKHIGNLESYLKENPVFIPKENKIKLGEMNLFKNHLKFIKKQCKNNQVQLTIIVPPLYENGLTHFSKEDIDKFYKKLASVTKYWDFSQSSINQDPRYFYTPFVARDSIGTMMLQRISGKRDPQNYLPEDFGKLITETPQPKVEEKAPTANLSPNDKSHSRKTLVLGFHHLDNEDSHNLSEEDFKNCLELLKKEGYTTVLPKDLEDYVHQGKELPKKPALITFDDGYLSFYDKAFPILKEMQMKAVSYFIGSSVGKSTYKDSSDQIYPHYSLEQGREMYQSGLIDIQSHTYDMHQTRKYEKQKEMHPNVLPLSSETPKEYLNHFNNDFLKNNSLVKEMTGNYTHSFAYPRGEYSPLTETLFVDKGIRSTMSVEPGTNVAIKGLPQSLYAMKRIFPHPKMTPEEMEEILKDQSEKIGLSATKKEQPSKKAALFLYAFFHNQNITTATVRYKVGNRT